MNVPYKSRLYTVRNVYELWTFLKQQQAAERLAS